MAADRDIILKVNQEECQAIADLLHGRKQVRMNPDETWTALKLMDLRQHVDAELLLSKAVPFIEIPARTKAVKIKCPHGVPVKLSCAKCIAD